MLTTTITGINATMTQGRDPSSYNNSALLHQYQDIVDNKRLHWTTHHHVERLLGSGGQGVVYLTDIAGRYQDLFSRPL